MTQQPVTGAKPLAFPREGKFNMRFESLLVSQPATLNELQQTFIRDHWLDEITRAQRRRTRNRAWFQFLRFVAVGGALALPALVSLNIGASRTGIQWATFAVSIVVTLSTAGLQVFRFGTEWGIDEQYTNALETEGWAYFQKAGKYLNIGYPAEAYQKFFAELENLYRLRNEKQVAEIIAVAAATAAASEASSPGTPATPSEAQVR
jgi:Protein of unknown function (DUF4231)